MSSANIACVRLLGLSAWVDAGDSDRVSFPLGLLYPYSHDLQRVCTCFDDVLREWPEAGVALADAARTDEPAPSAQATAAAEAFLESIAALHDRIAFTGPAGVFVARAHDRVSEALAHAGPTRAGSPVSA
jgi:hypothetical protein